MLGPLRKFAPAYDWIGWPHVRATDRTEPLAGVRLRSEIDNYVPPTCALCSATATDSCRWCERPICEDDFAHPDVCVECFVERLTT